MTSVGAQGRTAVVIVGHNSVLWLQACLDAVLLRAPDDGLVVYVDNASKDASCDIVRRYTRVHLVAVSSNRGFGAGCNIGAQTAIRLGASTLFFLNPDTRADWTAIEACAEMIDADSSIGIVGPLQQDLNDQSHMGASDFNAWTRRAVRTLSRDVLRDRQIEPLSSSDFESWLNDAPPFKATQYVNGAGLCISAILFSELGGFDERYFLFFEEVALCRIARLRGLQVGLCTRALIQHAWGGHDAGRRNAEWARSKYIYLLSDPEFPGLPAVRSAVRELGRDIARGPSKFVHAVIGAKTMVVWLTSRRGPRNTVPSLTR